MKNVTGFLAAGIALAGAVFAETLPLVSDVTMAQNRMGSRIVDIHYRLSQADALVTLTLETNNVPLPMDAVYPGLSGEVNQLVASGDGTQIHHIEWNPRLCWPDQTNNITARIRAWATNMPPYYMVVDLGRQNNAKTGFAVYYFADENAVEGGVTNDLYKTSRILMRWIEPTGPDGFVMGTDNMVEDGVSKANEGPAHTVVLTDGYYMGVYETTIAQWNSVLGLNQKSAFFTGNVAADLVTASQDAMRPIESVSYVNIRGSVSWPGSSEVSNSFISVLQTKTGYLFDLPTEAQWERACRGGTTTAVYSGNLTVANIEKIARDANNCANSGIPKKAATTSLVGCYTPNPFGLYDMNGNVWEFCRDRYSDTSYSSGTVTNPVGYTGTTSLHVDRGGSFYDPYFKCRSARRAFSEKFANYLGFRLYCPAKSN